MVDEQTPTEAANAPANAAPAEQAAWRMPYATQDFLDEIRRVKRRRIIGIILGVISALVIALVVVGVVVFKMPGSLYTVGTNGMAPELPQGQVVVVLPNEHPAAGEVIAFTDSTGNARFKRVSAVAGEWVNVASDGTVVISNRPLEGNSATGLVNGDAYIVSSRQVPEGYLFVKDDAGQVTASMLAEADSFISTSQVIGRAELKVWPLF